MGSTDDARTAKAASVMERKKPRRAPVGDAAAEATSLALRRNEEQLRELFTHASDAIFVADLDGHYTDVNEAGCSLLGYSRAELIGKGIVDLIVPEDVARLAHSKTQMLEGRVQIGEWALRHRDGHFVPVEVRAKIMPDGRWVGFIRDVAEHKRALDAMRDMAEELERRVAQRTEQLHRLVADLEAAEDRERRQIAHDLHDDLGQTLAAARIRLAGLCADPREDVRNAATAVDALIDSANRSTRSLAARLAPAVLYELGLCPALEWLGEEIKRVFGLKVTVLDDGRPKPLSQEARSILYRAARELLTNVAKHARTDSAVVETRRQGDQIVVRVSDAGVGFDATLFGAGPGGGHKLGLVSVRERMSFIGGTARVSSVAGEGTQAILSAQLSPDDAADATDGEPVPAEAAIDALRSARELSTPDLLPHLQGVVDALATHVAVLDRDGVIRFVNRAWREFAERNGDSDMRRCGPGINYLEVCRRSGLSDASARGVAQGLAAVLEGRRAGFSIAYPCHSPDEERWFLMQATPMADGNCLVTHFNMTNWIDPAHLPASLGNKGP